jgi:hypothetical protein
VARAGEQREGTRSRAKAGAVGPVALRPGPAGLLALQRLAGNRAASRVLARWSKHPDAEKKGVMVPDVVAAEFEHFNPPKNA